MDRYTKVWKHEAYWLDGRRYEMRDVPALFSSLKITCWDTASAYVIWASGFDSDRDGQKGAEVEIALVLASVRRGRWAMAAQSFWLELGTSQLSMSISVTLLTGECNPLF